MERAALSIKTDDLIQAMMCFRCTDGPKRKPRTLPKMMPQGVRTECKVLYITQTLVLPLSHMSSWSNSLRVHTVHTQCIDLPSEGCLL